jgi:hypothetical protein
VKEIIKEVKIEKILLKSKVGALNALNKIKILVPKASSKKLKSIKY